MMHTQSLPTRPGCRSSVKETHGHTQTVLAYKTRMQVAGQGDTQTVLAYRDPDAGSQSRRHTDTHMAVLAYKTRYRLPSEETHRPMHTLY